MLLLYYVLYFSVFNEFFKKMDTQQITEVMIMHLVNNLEHP